MTDRTFHAASLPAAVALAAWLLMPAWASAQHHGGGGHAGGAHAGSFHAGGFHSGGAAVHHGGWGGYRGYYGRGYGGYWGGRYGYWGGHRGYWGGWWPGFGIGLGLGLGYPWLYGGYYPWSYGYGYYPGSYAYYGTYEPWYGDYYGSYQPYVGTGTTGSYAQMYGNGTTYGYYEPSTTGLAPTAPGGDNSAYIRVRVPPDARVWFENAPTTQTGALREFESPPLTPDKTYSYDVRVQWTEGDREVTQTRHIDVHAGDRVTVDFTAPPAQGNAAPATSLTPPPSPAPSGAAPAQASPPPPPRPPGS